MMGSVQEDYFKLLESKARRVLELALREPARRLTVYLISNVDPNVHYEVRVKGLLTLYIGTLDRDSYMYMYRAQILPDGMLFVACVYPRLDTVPEYTYDVKLYRKLGFYIVAVNDMDKPVTLMVEVLPRPSKTHLGVKHVLVTVKPLSQYYTIFNELGGEDDPNIHIVRKRLITQVIDLRDALNELYAMYRTSVIKYSS